MSEKAVALVGGFGLGDNLIEMILLQNAYGSRCQTTVFSNIICELKEWFPQHNIEPSLPVSQFEEVLKAFSLYFWSGQLDDILQKRIGEQQIDYMNMQKGDRSQVENMVAVSSSVFNGHNPDINNGIVPLRGLEYKKYDDRVCIHPTSAEESKNWLPERFILLAKRLKKKGFAPVFIMSKAEVQEWDSKINGAFHLQGFPTISDCAAYLYESGFFIGNDSGGGHLASCLGIPTLSIHGRKKKAKLWKPGWGEVTVVTPPVNFVGSRLRQHYWKYLLSTNRVERSFKNLVNKSAD